VTHYNPFATLKYVVETVLFFDGKNIPLNYFIEGCEEAKSMLPDETESQFTKMIVTGGAQDLSVGTNRNGPENT